MIGVPGITSVALIRRWLAMMCRLHRSSGLSAKEPTKIGLFCERELPMQRA